MESVLPPLSALEVGEKTELSKKQTNKKLKTMQTNKKNYIKKDFPQLAV